MDDEQSTTPDAQDEPPLAKIQRAQALADQWQDDYEEWAVQAKILARFRCCTPRELVEMMKESVNERGEDLTPDEYEALSEVWHETFGEMPPIGRTTGASRADEEPAENDNPFEAHFAHNQMMSRKDVARALGVSESTVDRMTQQGRLPKKRQISEARVGWIASDIHDYIQNLQRKL